MKRIYLLVAAFLSMGSVASAQTIEGFDFEDKEVLFATPVKSQGNTSCCWDFAGLSMVESEIYRMTKREVDLSEMWIARHAYYEKAIRYVRMHGKTSYRAGGIVNDVMTIIKKYGVVPEEAYKGLRYGTPKHQHGELVEALRAYCAAVVANKNGTLSTAWIRGLNGILDAYLGKLPKTFEYEGQKYTPQSFTEMLGIDPDAYVGVTSFGCYPYNEWVQFEVPDNWMWNLMFNVELDDLRKMVSHSIKQGYTVAMACDITNLNFKKRPQVALLPARNDKEIRSEDLSRWPSITREVRKNMKTFAEPIPEREVTPERRNSSFLSYFTSDDHAMHIIGFAYDKNGTRYLKIKDSSHKDDKKGIGTLRYMSEPYMLYMSTSFLFRKEAVPAEILEKMGLTAKNDNSKKSSKKKK